MTPDPNHLRKLIQDAQYSMVLIEGDILTHERRIELDRKQLETTKWLIDSYQAAINQIEQEPA